jgi:hypothetical protein
MLRLEATVYFAASESAFPGLFSQKCNACPREMGAYCAGSLLLPFVLITFICIFVSTKHFLRATDIANKVPHRIPELKKKQRWTWPLLRANE